MGGEPRNVGGPKQRALLVSLVVELGNPVPVERLVRNVWADAPPATAPGTLQTYVTHLRKALAGTAAEIGLRPGAYVLTAPPETVDAERLETALRQAAGLLDSGDPGAALPLLEAAVESWRGWPLQEIPEAPDAEAPRANLEQMHVEALERLAEAGLLLGRHREIARDLRRFVHDHPASAALTGSLMLALYWQGKRSDALTVYRTIDERLSDDEMVSDDMRRSLRTLYDAIEGDADELADPGAPAAVALTGSSKRPFVRTSGARPPAVSSTAPAADDEQSPVHVATLREWTYDDDVRARWPRERTSFVEVELAGGARQWLALRADAPTNVRDVVAAIGAHVRPGEDLGSMVLFSDRLGYRLESLNPVPGPQVRSGDRLMLLSPAAADLEARARQTSVDVAVALLAVAGPCTGVMAPLEPGTHVVGRRGDVALADAMMSRRHFSVTAAPSGMSIQDLESKNGTFVRARRLASEAPVDFGELIEAGSSLLTMVDLAATLHEPFRITTRGAEAPPREPELLGAARDEIETMLNHPSTNAALTSLARAGAGSWPPDPSAREGAAVRVGWGDREPWARLTSIPRRHRNEAKDLAKDNPLLSYVPVLLSLAWDQKVLIAGARGDALSLARWIVVQLCFSFPPPFLSVTGFTDDEGRDEWTWLGWLPHFRSLSTVESASTPPDNAAASRAGDPAAHSLAVVDMGSARGRGPIALGRLRHLGLVVAVTEHVTDARGADVVIRLRPDSSVSVESARGDEVAAAWYGDGLPLEPAVLAARALAQRASTGTSHSRSVSSTKTRNRDAYT